MAKAIITGIEQSFMDAAVPKVQVGVIFGGVDVPGNFQKKSMIVDVSAVVNATDLGVAIAAAIRILAVNNGYTVGASNVFLPSYVTA